MPTCPLGSHTRGILFLEGIAGILKEARQSRGVTLLRRNIIVLESAHTARRSAPKPARGGRRRAS